MIKYIKILITVLLTISLSYSVGEAGAVFLLIAPGASAAGTGEAQVAKADDSYASYYNPAGLGFLRGSGYAGMHVNWLPVLADDIYYDFIAYRKHIKDKNCYNDNWRDCGTDGKCPGDDSYIMPDEDGTEGNGFWNEGESGTEGNGKYDIGEPFDDTGSDGILDSQQKEIRKYIKKLNKLNLNHMSISSEIDSLNNFLDPYLEEYEDLKVSISPIEHSSSEKMLELESQISDFEDIIVDKEYELLDNLFDLHDLIFKISNLLTRGNNNPDLKESIIQLEDLIEEYDDQEFFEDTNDKEEQIIDLTFEINEIFISPLIESLNSNQNDGTEGNGVWDLGEYFYDIGEDGVSEVDECSVGTLGANMTFLNLGSQMATDEFAKELGEFRSWMWQSTFSYGVQLSKKTSVGVGFKLFHQRLADSATQVGSQEGEPYSTDFAFDIGYLTKINETLRFGVSISNLGPAIDFINTDQADPAPTNLKIGIYKEWKIDDNNKIDFLLDFNRLLVARYPSMDWNGNGIIDSGTKETGYPDPWYKALYTCWIDDWYYDYDRDYDNDGIIGGYEFIENEYRAFNNNNIYLDNGGLYNLGDDASWILQSSLYENIAWGSEGDTFTSEHDVNEDGYWTPAEPYFESDNGQGFIGVDNSLFGQTMYDQNLAWDDIYSTQVTDFNYQFEFDNQGELNDWHAMIVEDGKVVNVEYLYWVYLEHENRLVQVKASIPNSGTQYILDLFIDCNADQTICEGDEGWSPSLGNGEWDWIDLDGDGMWDSDESGEELSNWDSSDFDHSDLEITEIIMGDGIFDDEEFIDWNNDASLTLEEQFEDGDGNQTYNTAYSPNNSRGRKEIGSGKDYSFEDELKEIISNIGFQYWYTDNFVLRLGYIYDRDGQIMNPTFGAGIRFGQYGFDFGYTGGEKGHARSETMFFSISMDF